MRYLNKIILINSASTKYAEVQIDGNIHFIGTQGVGKSTILRAILFFYNANTLKLGISKEKQHFAEYYLPYADSYIVYEVQRESGNFCVTATKSQGRVCFRFIDTPYDRKYFVAENGSAFESWDKSKAMLDADNIYYTRKLNKYEEYRDVIYGNQPPRSEFTRFAILESKQFQNIPRTIQNVFLNSKLEAEFIKETIINSLNDEDVKVNLQTYQYELKGFEDELNDLQQFKKPRIIKQADDISRELIGLKHHRKEKLKLAASLGASWALAQEKKPLLEDYRNVKLQESETNTKKIDSAESVFDGRKERIISEITKFKTLLDTARQRWQSYQDIGINSIIGRIGKKSDLELEGQNLAKEKDLLGAHYKEISHKYDLLVNELKNQLSAYENAKKSERIEEKEHLMQEIEHLKEMYKKQIEEIKKQSKSKRDDAETELNELNVQLNNLRVQRAEVKHKRLYEQEIEQARNEIGKQKNAVQVATNKVTLAKGQLESLQRKWQAEVDGARHKVEYEIKAENTKIEQASAKIKEITLKIENSKDSFYGWLNKNISGWENNIGKICDEEILFYNELSPEKDNKGKDNFFGVKLNLNELPAKVKTVEDYHNEIAALGTKIDNHKIAILKLQEELELESERIKRNHNQRIKQLNDEVKEQEYTIAEGERRMQAAELRLIDFNEKAKKEKALLLSELDANIGSASEAVKNAQSELEKIRASIYRRVRAKEQDLENALDEAKAESTQRQRQINEMIAQHQAEMAEREKELVEQKNEELSSKGANTKRLNEIDSRLAVIKDELKFIDKNRDRLADYKKDKRELFDQEKDFQNSKRFHENQLKLEQQKYDSLKKQLITESERIKKEVAAAEKDLAVLNEDFTEMARFMSLSWFEEIGELVRKGNSSNHGNIPCRKLIAELTETHYAIIDLTNSLTEQVAKFLSHFSDQNIFNFDTKLSDTPGYISFAEELSGFIEDNRISEYEKRVNERYAEIIRLIGSETSDLTSKQGEIQRVVNNVNRDFTEKNFAGVIKKIELRLGDTNNKVVQVLKLIKNFNDNHQIELGAPNLFSQHNSSKNNQKAVDLLKQLVTEIKKLRKDYISLADSFELQFRVIENDNDTGWVERLANVGSEGTDVLVKAMVNIMLLNVFKEGASKRFKAFKLHCMMDEVGRLHPSNVRGILQFANDRNIMLINGSPTEHDALAYRHIYKLEKDAQSVTKIKRIMTQA